MKKFKKTVFILGPSGIGKSNLDLIFSSQVVRINPYRLREGGPREEKILAFFHNGKRIKKIEKDWYYASPELKIQTEYLMELLEDKKKGLGEDIYWYPKGKTLIFKVRKTWQVLPFLKYLRQDSGKYCKAEIYTLLFPHLLTRPDFDFFGEAKVIILNPADVSITCDKEGVLGKIKEATEKNLSNRGDTMDNIKKRVVSLDKEFKVWKQLLTDARIKEKVTEYINWQFPEYKYYQSAGVEKIIGMAKDCLLQKNKELKEFFVS